MTSVTVSAVTSGDNTLVAAPGLGKRIQVQGLTLIANGTVSAYIYSGSTPHFADSTNKLAMAVNAGFSLQPVTSFWFICEENQALKLNLSAGVAVVGVCLYDIV